MKSQDNDRLEKVAENITALGRRMVIELNSSVQISSENPVYEIKGPSWRCLVAFRCPAGICKGKAFTNEEEVNYNFGTIEAFVEYGNCVKSMKVSFPSVATE